MTDFNWIECARSPMDCLQTNYPQVNEWLTKPVLWSVGLAGGWCLSRRLISWQTDKACKRVALPNADLAACNQAKIHVEALRWARVGVNFFAPAISLFDPGFTTVGVFGAMTLLSWRDLKSGATKITNINALAACRRQNVAKIIEESTQLASTCNGSHLVPIVTLATVTVVAFAVLHLSLTLSLFITTMVAVCHLMRRGMQVEALVDYNQKLTSTVSKLQNDLQGHLIKHLSK